MGSALNQVNLAVTARDIIKTRTKTFRKVAFGTTNNDLADVVCDIVREYDLQSLSECSTVSVVTLQKIASNCKPYCPRGDTIKKIFLATGHQLAVK